VLYNPPHAKRVLPAATLKRLSEAVPQLVGAKVAPPDANWFTELGDVLQTLSIFTPGHFLATHYPLGSRGSYSNVACISPRGAGRWFDMIRRDDPQAAEIQKRLLAFFAEHITPYISQHGYCNAAADKLLAAIGGWCDIPTRLRWPYRWIPEADVHHLRPLAQRAVPEFFA